MPIRIVVKRALTSLVILIGCAACDTAQDLGARALIRQLHAVEGVDQVFRTPALGICSKLNIESLRWPDQMSAIERDAMILALNVTSSYEGHERWNTIANNFDGQGLSLGLLNQCLGQGTLQVLMLELREKYGQSFNAVFNAEQLPLVSEMLSKWKAYPRPPKAFTLRDYGFSELDDEDKIAELTGLDVAEITRGRRPPRGKPRPRPKPKPKPPAPKPLNPENQESVNWALKNLYSDAKGLQFKPEWKDALQVMADTGDYRTLQLAEALSIYNRALALYNYYKMTQMRSFLFFFDLQVQNGGISPEVVAVVDRELAKLKNPDETKRLQTILNVRLRYVKKRWMNDVKSRKTAIINGVGKVHGKDRNFNVEYCADLTYVLPPMSAALPPLDYL